MNLKIYYYYKGLWVVEGLWWCVFGNTLEEALTNAEIFIGGKL